MKVVTSDGKLPRAAALLVIAVSCCALALASVSRTTTSGHGS
jgi:hypothetical protein